MGGSKTEGLIDYKRQEIGIVNSPLQESMDVVRNGRKIRAKEM